MRELKKDKETTKPVSQGTWSRYLLGPALFTLALAHALKPSEVALDWQTIVLVLVGAVAVAVPDLADIIRNRTIRVKVGDVEVEFMSMTATQLGLNVGFAELESEVPRARTAPRSKVAFAPVLGLDAGIAFTPAPDLEAAILDLASRDKETAIMRLGVEIERELQSLVGRSGVGEPPPRAGWTALAEFLEARGVAVPAHLKDTLRDFAEIRTAAAHGVPTHGVRISGRILNSALDSGLRLKRLLEYLPGAQDGEKSA